MKTLVILASGQGSNARAVIAHLHSKQKARVLAVLSNREKPGVKNVAEEYDIPFRCLHSEGGSLLKTLHELNPDLILLSGYLKMIPSKVVSAFNHSIINIHPSILPQCGGPGMYGRHVHEAVLKAGEKESGVSIHYVDEEYDTGELIAQFYCPVFPDDSVEKLQARVQALEHRYLPLVIETLLT